MNVQPSFADIVAFWRHRVRPAKEDMAAKLEAVSFPERFAATFAPSCVQAANFDYTRFLVRSLPLSSAPDWLRQGILAWETIAERIFPSTTPVRSVFCLRRPKRSRRPVLRRPRLTSVLSSLSGIIGISLPQDRTDRLLALFDEGRDIVKTSNMENGNDTTRLLAADTLSDLLETAAEAVGAVQVCQKTFMNAVLVLFLLSVDLPPVLLPSGSEKIESQGLEELIVRTWRNLVAAVAAGRDLEEDAVPEE